MTTGRARTKLQRLLQDLALGDSSSALPTADFTQQSSKLQGEEDALSCDDSDLDAHSMDLSEFSEPARQCRSANVTQTMYLQMERRAVQLMQENRMLHATHQQHAKQADLELSQMRAQLKMVLHEMEQRQREVEAKAPIMQSRLEDFRGRLHDLRISEAQYQELLGLPAEGLHILDQIKVAIYEQNRDVSREAEQLRLALATSREAASRLEEETSRLRAEASRSAAALAEKDRDVQQSIEAFQSRISRLSSELEQALIRAELNSAKGQMYDELRAKAERLECENQRLQVVEATFKRFEQQAAEAAQQHTQRDHALQMLQMDKAYLSKQVEFMGEQQRKLQGEVEMREQQVQELQKVKQELYEKLMQGESSRGRQDEGRLQQELAKLQASTHADLKRIRTETAETYEREARLLREIRDQAVDEASRLRIAHAELKDVHEHSVAVGAEVQRRLESQVMELQAELRQKAFELGHLMVVLGEKEGLLGQANMQLDLVQEKMQVLRERCHTLETQLLSGPAAPEGRHGATAFPQAKQRATGADDDTRMQWDTTLVSGPHAEALAAVRVERQQLQAQVSSLQAQLKEARGALDLVGQPHAFLLAHLAAAKARAEELTQRAVALQAQLVASEGKVTDLAAERDALKRDLDALLVQQGTVEQMKAMVMRALGAGGAAAAPPPGPTVVLQGLGAAGTTMILGEGPSRRS